MLGDTAIRNELFLGVFNAYYNETFYMFVNIIYIITCIRYDCITDRRVDYRIICLCEVKDFYMIRKRLLELFKFCLMSSSSPAIIETTDYCRPANNNTQAPVRLSGHV